MGYTTPSSRPKPHDDHKPAVSVIIPVYNRRDILKKTLLSFGDQTVSSGMFEVIVVDDGSTDGTGDMIAALNLGYPLVYIYQPHRGIPVARNRAIREARGELIISVDSDMVVAPEFVEAHLSAHTTPGLIVHGPVIYTNNLEDPRSERQKVTDFSAAFFATGNVSIAKKHLIDAGLFDEDFVEYGWEDLEFGRRLKALGLKAAKALDARGYHLKPAFSLDHLGALIEKERQRGHMAVVYYRKHPTLKVRMSTMISPVFFFLDGLCNLGGWTGKPFAGRLLRRLDARGPAWLRNALIKVILNHAYAEGIKEALSGRWRLPSRMPK